MVVTSVADGPHPVDRHVGRRLAERRLELGYSQSELANALGLTFQQVQKYEKGTNRVSASKLWAAAAFLGVEVSFFFDGLTHDLAAAREDQFLPTPTRTTVELQRLVPRLSAARQKMALDLVRELAEPSAPTDA